MGVNLGHYVGLDVHDGGSSPNILERGMVITVEPGIYFNAAILEPALENPQLVRLLNDLLVSV